MPEFAIVLVSRNLCPGTAKWIDEAFEFCRFSSSQRLCSLRHVKTMPWSQGYLWLGTVCKSSTYAAYISCTLEAAFIRFLISWCASETQTAAPRLSRIVTGYTDCHQEASHPLLIGKRFSFCLKSCRGTAQTVGRLALEPQKRWKRLAAQRKCPSAPSSVVPCCIAIWWRENKYSALRSSWPY